MPHRARSLARLLVPLPLAALALVPATANAATAPHVVSFEQARLALPASAAMPGKPRTVLVSTEPGFSRVAPCLESLTGPPVMKQSHGITALYFPSAQGGYNFTVSAVVFHTAAAAQVGLSAVLKAEKHCPTKQTDPDGSSVVRTLSARYGVGSWTGWRSVDHLTIAADPADEEPGLSARFNSEFLVKGNVMLAITEVGQLGPHSDLLQETARKKATTTVLAAFNKL